LEQLESQGVNCIFASPIAVMAPIWEALARREDDLKLRYFRCRHELLAVSLASGYYKASGRSQIVFLPTSLGVQNGSMGLHTALQERTPMTVLSPDTLTYGEDPAADPGPEWPSLLVDLVGPARNAEAVVKWTKRARTPSELVHELRRACHVAESGPPGPTLLEIPFDLLVGDGYGDIPTWVSPHPSSPRHNRSISCPKSWPTRPIRSSSPSTAGEPRTNATPWYESPSHCPRRSSNS
jgi:acetolactate synthase I/II/III large subunit